MTPKSIIAMEGLNRTLQAAKMIEEVTFMLGSARLSEKKKKKKNHQAGRRKNTERKTQRKIETEIILLERRKGKQEDKKLDFQTMLEFYLNATTKTNKDKYIITCRYMQKKKKKCRRMKP